MEGDYCKPLLLSSKFPSDILSDSMKLMKVCMLSGIYTMNL